ncbi:hypothetical protein ACIO13_00280 [Streptomyces sp. NPDC087425]|uniref:hypothetical protein n=1 Tax=Streptomyces sp. NPDC087425 TaxID=3365787 RepID=UPI00381FA1CB
MSAEPNSDHSTARRPRRSSVANAAFALGVLVVLATTVLGAFAAVALLLDTAALASVVPDAGRNALVIGGIALGGGTGLFVPVVLFGMVRGNDTTPRVGPGAAARTLLALLVFDAYVLALSLLVSQAGRLLPEKLTTLTAVFAIGFSWMPLAMIPWKRLGLGQIAGGHLGKRGSSPQKYGPSVSAASARNAATLGESAGTLGSRTV